jgi:hypothetical protein
MSVENKERLVDFRNKLSSKINKHQPERKNMKATARTGNGAVAFEHSEDNLVEFFSKAGSLYVNKGTYYGNESTALELFKNAWRTDNYKSMQLAMWLRDCRGGSGNRSGFRAIINWLGNNYPEWIKANIALIPKYGRWDDLVALYNTPCEKDALHIWSLAIQSVDANVFGLAAKWADRQDVKLRNYMGFSPKGFRKLLVSKTMVVESLMCSGRWEKVNYNHVPSVASARYANAFKKHDETRYNEWRESLASPESVNKVNAEVLLPHDIVRMVQHCYGDDPAVVNALAEAQLKAIPNYMEKTNKRIMSILDFSGSMSSVNVAGSVTALDVALGLGLYCSEKVGSNNPFYRAVIPFSTNSKLVSWKGMSLVAAINKIPNGYCGSTDIKQALKVLLDAGKFFNATNDQMPNVLLILSDMQFDQGVTHSETPVEESLKEWEAAGYARPQIVYWNLAGYQNQPETAFKKDVALVSGYSPSVLKAVLSGEDFTPIAVMNRTISKYEITDPRTIKG